MEGYATEEQQVEAIKKWWKQNGTNVVTGGLLVLALFFGGRAWFDYRDGQSEAASVEYEAMMQSMRAGEKDAVFSRGDTLLQKYSGTPYATLAAFALARVKLEQKDPVAAEAHLRWVLANNSEDGIQNITKLRLARVLLAQDKHEEALKMIPSDTSSFKSAFEEVKGDIYLAKGDKEAAQSAYSQALLALPADSNNNALLQMKLDDFGQATTSAEDNNQ